MSARRQRRIERVERMRKAGVEPLGFGGRIASAAIIIGAIGIGGVGFAASFANVTKAMTPAFGEWAWLVPAGIDLGIAVTIGLDILLAKMRMRPAWLRFIPWGLTGITIWLNASGHSGIGLVGHVSLPAMFIVMSEVGAHVIRVRAGLAAGETREGPRLPRWLVAPVETVQLWMIMARTPGVDTYEKALAEHHGHVMAAVALREAWGIAWRIKAPHQLRARHRLGTLTATDVTTAKAAADGKPKASAKTDTKPNTASKPAKPSRRTSKTSISDDDALAAIRALPTDKGGHIAVKAAARAAGIGVDRARRLLDANNLLAPRGNES
ncbi:DUF2637 domain-containing protein [Stackebrandtia endophytica]|uniref:DUF2637 domain-containing protein n=1 Tax=Stackebrandtia endophytica TaxID=1496996 RepID=UPI00114F7F98|nr:DUF2637 domain-containing protein [Stackebrandtia endophytica]